MSALTRVSDIHKPVPEYSHSRLGIYPTSHKIKKKQQRSHKTKCTLGIQKDCRLNVYSRFALNKRGLCGLDRPCLIVVSIDQQHLLAYRTCLGPTYLVPSVCSGSLPYRYYRIHTLLSVQTVQHCIDDNLTNKKRMSYHPTFSRWGECRIQEAWWSSCLRCR